MSFILDTLGRKPAKPADRGDDQRARADRALAALGYPPGATGRRRAVRLTLYGLAAIGIGFAGMTAVVLIFAPSASQNRPARKQPAPIPSPSTSVPAVTKPDALPRTPSAPLLGATPAGRPRVGQPSGSAFEHRKATAAVAPSAAASVHATDHFDLALDYQRAGDLERAIAEYRALLAQDDASVEVHDNLGLLYADRGQIDEAIKHFRRAIELDPSSIKAHNNLGVALMRAGELNGAAAEFRIALENDSRNVEPLVNLALVQKAAGRSAEAQALLQRAVRLAPSNAGAHYNLAVVADENGDAAMAIDHYRSFLRYASPSNNGLTAQVRARLAALGG